MSDRIVRYNGDAEKRIEKMREFSREKGCLDSFESNLNRIKDDLFNQGKIRVTIGPELFSDTDFAWRIDRLNREGEWTQVYYGGLNYHRASNEWSINS